MIAITCPQCGSLIENISVDNVRAHCDYCGANILIPDERERGRQNVDISKPFSPRIYDGQGSDFNSGRFVGIVLAIVVIGGALLFGLFSQSLKKRPFTSSPTPTPGNPAISVPGSEKNTDFLLAFGEKGKGQGQFTNPSEIAVDDKGNIYVSDETLRVQRFDPAGKFLNLWNVKGDKDEVIDKLAVDAEGTVFVLIGGELVLYNGETGEKKHVLTDSQKHYIDDCILLDDGGMLLAAENKKNEEIIQINKGHAVVRRLVGIHSKAAKTVIPPQAVRLAVDGKGDIYSVYALGDVTGEFNYDDEDLMTFHFSPDGKFINKFAAGLTPTAIAADSQGRIYILNGTGSGSSVAVFSSDGNKIKQFSLSSSPFATIRAMASDKQNNLYFIKGDSVNGAKVQKMKAIDFGT